MIAGYRMIAALILLAAQAGAQEQEFQLPATNPLAVVRQQVASTEIEVTYRRPTVKGRVIFGELVPFGQVWRTGSDAATTISFSTRQGDVCGFGYNVVNSETGFRALAISHYILRYVCSNGAVVPVRGMKKRNHYGHAQGELFSLFDSWLTAGEVVRKQVVLALEASVSKQLNGEREKVVKAIDGLLGGGEGRALVRRLPVDATRYTLFNEITHMAKDYPIGVRLQLEMIAGDPLAFGVRSRKTPGRVLIPD